MTVLVRIYLLIVNFLAVISVSMLAVLVILIGGEAITRTLNLPFLPGVVELSEYALYMMAMLAAPWLLHHNGHLAVNVVTDLLPKRARAATALLAWVLGLCATSVTFWIGLQLLMQSYRSGQLIFRDLVVHDWLLQWQVPLAMALMSIEFLGRIISTALPPAGAVQHEAR